MRLSPLLPLMLLPVLSAGRASVQGVEMPDPGARAWLTNAAQVHQLDAETAQQHLPVRLDAVVTHFNDRLGHGLFVQDATDGVYVNLGTNRVSVKTGDRLLLEGTTGTGDYAPVVLLQRWQVLGRAPLPEAERVTASALATGRFDSHRVKVRGVAGGIFSRQHQLLSPVVLLDADDDLEVVSPPQHLESLPRVTIRSMFRFSPEGFPARRVRLHGRLLGRQAGRCLAVHDGTSGLFVESGDGDSLLSGDQLELIGFPEMREQTFWLVNAQVHRLTMYPFPDERGCTRAR